MSNLVTVVAVHRVLDIDTSSEVELLVSALDQKYIRCGVVIKKNPFYCFAPEGYSNIKISSTFLPKLFVKA